MSTELGEIIINNLSNLVNGIGWLLLICYLLRLLNRYKRLGEQKIHYHRYRSDLIISLLSPGIGHLGYATLKRFSMFVIPSVLISVMTNFGFFVPTFLYLFLILRLLAIKDLNKIIHKINKGKGKETDVSTHTSLAFLAIAYTIIPFSGMSLAHYHLWHFIETDAFSSLLQSTSIVFAFISILIFYLYQKVDDIKVSMNDLRRRMIVVRTRLLANASHLESALDNDYIHPLYEQKLKQGKDKIKNALDDINFHISKSKKEVPELIKNYKDASKDAFIAIFIVFILSTLFSILGVTMTSTELKKIEINNSNFGTALVSIFFMDCLSLILIATITYVLWRRYHSLNEEVDEISMRIIPAIDEVIEL